MLNVRGDDVVASGSIGPGNALDGVIVGFRATAGEQHFVVVAPQHTCDLMARSIHTGASLQAEGMPTRRIAVETVDVRQHGLGHLRVYRCGGVVVEIDGSHLSLQLSAISRQNLLEQRRHWFDYLWEIVARRVHQRRDLVTFHPVGVIGKQQF